MKAIIHAKAVTPGGIIEDATVLLEGGIIRAVGKNLQIPDDAEVLDAEGMWVGPGFVDIHVHGGGGADFGSMFEEADVDAGGSEFGKQLREAFKHGEWEELGSLLGNKFNEVFSSIYWEFTILLLA